MPSTDELSQPGLFDEFVTSDGPETEPPTESLGPPYPLALIGLGASIGMFSRLIVASGFFTTINSRGMTLVAAGASALVALGIMFMARQRDQFGASLAWIAGITALSWAAFNWISPPFPEPVTIWSNSQQMALSVLGFANGLLLASLVTLAFVRRKATLSVAAAMFAGVAVLAANTFFMRNEWPAVVALGLAFALNLWAWDQSPRREPIFEKPPQAPRVSRAVLGLIAVAISGAAIQHWLGRTDSPRSLPAVIVAGVLILGAFASMIRVRREIQQRETALSEWRQWWRTSRKDDFRAEMANFDATADADVPAADVSTAERPRQLSFPGLTVDDDAAPDSLADEIGVLEAPAKPAPLPSLSAALSAAADEMGMSVDLDDDNDLPGAAPVGVGLVPDIVVPRAFGGSTSSQTSVDHDLHDPETGAAPSLLASIADYSSVMPDLLVADSGVVADPAPNDEPASKAPVPAAPPAMPAAKVAEPVDTKKRLPRIDLSPKPQAPKPKTGGIFSFYAGPDELEPDLVPQSTAPGAAPVSALTVPPDPQPDAAAFVGDLDDLSAWLGTVPATDPRKRLLVAVEAMPLSEFDQLTEAERSEGQEAIGGFLADAMPTAEVVAWIDGPYFIVAHPSVDARNLKPLNASLNGVLRGSNGVHALMRISDDTTFDDVVRDAVQALLQARNAATTAGH